MIALIVISILLFVLLSIYRTEYGRRVGLKEQEVGNCNKELAMILQRGQMQLWTYNVANGTYAWMDDERAHFVSLQPKEFASHYSPKVFQHVTQAIQELIRGDIDKKTLRIALVMKDGSKRYFALDMSVLRRDEKGAVAIVATFQNDITEVHLRETRDRETRMRYESVFNSAMTDMVYYDSLGHISNMNKRACETFGIDVETAKRLGISVEMAVNEPGFDHHNFETFHATQVRPSTLAENHVKSEKLKGKMCYEIQVTPVYDARRRMVCAYGSGLNVTEIADAYYCMQEDVRKTRQANEALTSYVRNINFAMKVGGVRLVEYDPRTRVLTVFKETDVVQLKVTAERAMRFVEGKDHEATKHIFDRMDNLMPTPFNHQIHTTIRQPGGLQLYLFIYFMPVYDEQGSISSYFGMVRDFTEAKAIERRLANETIRSRQEEAQKNQLMRNMSFEIRTLLNTVVGFADLLRQDHTADDENSFIAYIKEYSSQLLDLINGILLLSKLNAGTIESRKHTIDLAQMLPKWCNAGYNDFRHDGVDYIVEQPYPRFVADIDATNLGIVITQLCSNGARLTPKGVVRTYYTYHDGLLAISVESHGKGISAEQLEHIYEYFGTAMQTQTGLSLPICHSIMQLLGGTIDIQSDYGRQTTITVTLPCQNAEL